MPMFEDYDKTVNASQQAHFFSEDETNAYYAKPACKGNQTPASGPLQLTVGYNTTLLLSVSRQNDSDAHVFMARLLGSAGAGLSNKLLTLELNDTGHEYNRTSVQHSRQLWGRFACQERHRLPNLAQRHKIRNMHNHIIQQLSPRQQYQHNSNAISGYLRRAAGVSQQLERILKFCCLAFNP
jgi:hypothetical protein